MLDITQLVGFGARDEVYHATAGTYFKRTTGMTLACMDDINTLVQGLDDDGVLALLDVLCVAGDADTTANASANSLLNIIENSTNYDATKVNSPIFTVNSGWTTYYLGFLSAQLIDSNFTAKSGAKFNTNDNSYGAYLTEGPARDVAYLGCSDYTNNSDIRMKRNNTGSDVSGRNETDADLTTDITPGSYAGFFGCSRRGAIDTRMIHTYSGGTVTVDNTDAVVDAVSQPLAHSFGIGCSKDGAGSYILFGGAAGNQQDTAAWVFGGGLDNTKLAALGTRLQTYFTSRGVAV